MHRVRVASQPLQAETPLLGTMERSLAGEAGAPSSPRAPRGRHDPDFGRRLSRDPGSCSHILAPGSRGKGMLRVSAPSPCPAGRDAGCRVSSWRNHGKLCRIHGCRSSPWGGASHLVPEGRDGGRSSSQPTWGRGSSNFSLWENQSL